MHLDFLLESLGSFGRYQISIFLLLCLVCMRNSWNPFIVVFLAGEPPHHCKPPGGADYNSSIPIDSNDENGCKMFMNASDQDGIPCTNGWIYDESYGQTIVSDVSIKILKGSSFVNIINF